MRNAVAFLTAGATCLVLSALGAVVTTSIRGRGTGDIPAFLFWSAPFSIVVSSIVVYLLPFVSRRRAVPGFLISAGVGTLLGFAWTFVVARGLGPFFAAFSFAVGPVWIIASGVSTVVALYTARRSGIVSAILALVVPVATVLLLNYAVPQRPLDALVTLRQGATEVEAQLVRETVLGRREPPREGYGNLPGLATIAGWDTATTKRFRISFHRTVDAKRREEMLQQIRDSELVASVEDVARQE